MSHIDIGSYLVTLALAAGCGTVRPRGDAAPGRGRPPLLFAPALGNECARVHRYITSTQNDSEGTSGQALPPGLLLDDPIVLQFLKRQFGGPVVDPATGACVGVITHSDVRKLLTVYGCEGREYAAGCEVSEAMRPVGEARAHKFAVLTKGGMLPHTQRHFERCSACGLTSPCKVGRCRLSTPQVDPRLTPG